MAVSAEDIKRVKAMGCLFNRESEDEFNVRVITGNGTLTADQLANVSEAAEKYGSGTVAMTTRLTIEISGVHYDDIPTLQAHLAKADLYTGGTGDHVRPVVACKGTTCVFGQVDTQGIARKIHERFFEGWKDVELPHKFKIAVGGCPNNCVKPDLNDFGLVGQNMPKINDELCRGCKKCAVEATCQMLAPKVQDKKITIDRDVCNSCGKCIKACYFHCLSSEAHGVKVELGGKWGRKRRPADAVSGIYSVEEALDMLEKALLVYRKLGYKKERFGDMIERIGFDKIEPMVTSDDILREKDAILAAAIQKRP